MKLSLRKFLWNLLNGNGDLGNKTLVICSLSVFLPSFSSVLMFMDYYSYDMSEDMGYVGTALWDLEIEELEGHNLEVKGREEVNALLGEGWILLHIYTLKYKEEGEWRERPMAILGRPKKLHDILNLENYKSH